jgi:hypothetical protein
MKYKPMDGIKINFKELVLLVVKNHPCGLCFCDMEIAKKVGF